MDFSFLPTFGNTALAIVAFVVVLSIIVAIHEYGHYIVGRWTGIHAEVFSLGFGPVLWSRVDRRGTKWQLAALPFGGYVKFLGDANSASAGADQQVMAGLSDEERRHTMAGAPLWARSLTVAAGPVFNFILSFFIFTAVVLGQGITSVPLTIAKMHDLPYQNDLRPGDVILSVEGYALNDPALSAHLNTLQDVTNYTYTIERDGRELQALGPVLSPTRVARTDPTLPARDAGIQEGDVILSVAGQPVYRFNDLIPMIANLDGAPVVMTLLRDGEEMEVTVTPKRRDLPLPDGGFETRWLVGISSDYFFEPVVETPGLLEAAGYGVAQIWSLITTTFSGISHMISGAISSCNISGPIGIAEMSGTAAAEGTTTFIMFIGIISTAIGLINLMPIPVLDGGHLVFYAYEAIARRKPPEKIVGAIMTMGLVLILSLMVFAVTNDLFCP